MNNFFITTDQTADFPSQIAEQDFAILPMSYVIDGVIYDGETTPYLPTNVFYDLIEAGKVSKTSMTPVEKCEEFFENIAKTGKDLLHISFSSALSGSYGAYVEASKRVMAKYPERKIMVLDSLSASAGEALLCYYAFKMRAECQNIEETYAYLDGLRHKIGHIFTVDDIMHLYRGGRISIYSATVGNAMRVKPILIVNEEGMLVPIAKIISRRLAIKTLADKIVEQVKLIPNELIIIGHGDANTDAVYLKNLILEHCPGKRIILTEIGAVIGSHCGKNVLAGFFIADSKSTTKTAEKQVYKK